MSLRARIQRLERAAGAGAFPPGFDGWRTLDLTDDELADLLRTWDASEEELADFLSDPDDEDQGGSGSDIDSSGEGPGRGTAS